MGVKLQRSQLHEQLKRFKFYKRDLYVEEILREDALFMIDNSFFNFNVRPDQINNEEDKSKLIEILRALAGRINFIKNYITNGGQIYTTQDVLKEYEKSMRGTQDRDMINLGVNELVLAKNSLYQVLKGNVIEEFISDADENIKDIESEVVKLKNDISKPDLSLFLNAIKISRLMNKQVIILTEDKDFFYFDTSNRKGYAMVAYPVEIYIYENHKVITERYSIFFLA